MTLYEFEKIMDYFKCDNANVRIRQKNDYFSPLYKYKNFSFTYDGSANVTIEDDTSVYAMPIVVNNKKELITHIFEILKKDTCTLEEDYLNIESQILSDMRPDITASEWINNNSKIENSYNQDIYNSTERRILWRISDFDKSVNPFTNITMDPKSLEILLAENTLKCESEKVLFNNISNDCSFYIINNDTQNYTYYSRNSDGFLYQLVIKDNPEEFLNVIHFYDTGKGNILYINFFDPETKKNVCIVCNFSLKYYEINGNILNELSRQDFEYILQKVFTAIEKAQDITFSPYYNHDADFIPLELL